MRLSVERLGHLGDGIGRGPDGAPVFVPMALPGEVVEGEVAAGRMAVPKIAVPSPDRVAAACPHYRACGGCALMHASNAFVAAWKQEVVHTALAAQGIAAAFRPVITSPPRSRRRATLAGRRTKKGAIVGFHGRASGTIVEVPGCQVLHPDLTAALPVLAGITAIGASRQSEVALALTRSEGALDVAVSGGKRLEQSLFAELSTIARQAGLARLTWDGEIVASYRAVSQNFGRARVAPPPGAPSCRRPRAARRRWSRPCAMRSAPPAGSPISSPARAPSPCRLPRRPTFTPWRARPR